MSDTWAAKVLEGVPRHYDANCDRVIMEADALAAIARMGVGDGLVERLLRVSIDMGDIPSTTTLPSEVIREAAAHIAALTAQVAMAEKYAHEAGDRVVTAEKITKETQTEAAALRAKVARLEGALHNCVGMLDCLVAESGRSIEWDQEDPFRMGEWFEPDDLKQLAQARAALTDGAADE